MKLALLAGTTALAFAAVPAAAQTVYVVEEPFAAYDYAVPAPAVVAPAPAPAYVAVAPPYVAPPPVYAPAPAFAYAAAPRYVTATWGWGGSCWIDRFNGLRYCD